MKSLKRFHQANANYFVTVVTHGRVPILVKNPALFSQSWGNIKPSVWAVLPDHFHAIVEADGTDISTMMHRFKITYSRYYRIQFGAGRVWQNRFWDHIIRDQTDMNRHTDYIHYNPVSHGLCDDPFVYPHSSLKDFLAKGMYERNWGVAERPEFSGEFGE